MAREAVQESQGLGRKSVLVVDDEADLRELICEYLELNGIEAVGASQGAEALSLLGHLHPGAIVLDLMMPVMDGWETLKLLRADPELAGIPVVVASAFPTAARSVEAAVASVLQKPFSLEALLGVLERLEAGPLPH